MYNVKSTKFLKVDKDILDNKYYSVLNNLGEDHYNPKLLFRTDLNKLLLNNISEYCIIDNSYQFDNSNICFKPFKNNHIKDFKFKAKDLIGIGYNNLLNETFLLNEESEYHNIIKVRPLIPEYLTLLIAKSEFKYVSEYIHNELGKHLVNFNKDEVIYGITKSDLWKKFKDYIKDIDKMSYQISLKDFKEILDYYIGNELFNSYKNSKYAKIFKKYSDNRHVIQFKDEYGNTIKQRLRCIMGYNINNIDYQNVKKVKEQEYIAYKIKNNKGRLCNNNHLKILNELKYNTDTPENNYIKEKKAHNFISVKNTIFTNKKKLDTYWINTIRRENRIFKCRLNGKSVITNSKDYKEYSDNNAIKAEKVKKNKDFNFKLNKLKQTTIDISKINVNESNINTFYKMFCTDNTPIKDNKNLSEITNSSVGSKDFKDSKVNDLNISNSLFDSDGLNDLNDLDDPSNNYSDDNGLYKLYSLSEIIALQGLNNLKDYSDNNVSKDTLTTNSDSLSEIINSGDCMDKNVEVINLIEESVNISDNVINAEIDIFENGLNRLSKSEIAEIQINFQDSNFLYTKEGSRYRNHVQDNIVKHKFNEEQENIWLNSLKEIRCKLDELDNLVITEEYKNQNPITEDESIILGISSIKDLTSQKLKSYISMKKYRLSDQLIDNMFNQLTAVDQCDIDQVDRVKQLEDDQLKEQLLIERSLELLKTT
jgi:hypothetical protein